jgi:phosphate transport system permease protein
MASTLTAPSPSVASGRHALGTWHRWGNRGFRGLTWLAAWAVVVLVAAIIGAIAQKAWPAFGRYGWGFFSGRVWDQAAEHYGVLPPIWGTLYSSLLALVFASICGVAVAVLLGDHLLAGAVRSLMQSCGVDPGVTWPKLPQRVEYVVNTLVELLAAIPSVVYGLWGLFVLVPLIRPPCNWLHAHFGQVPFFSTPLSGPGLLPASLVLGIMVLPTIAAISRDAILGVPDNLREAAYGVGATRWETILRVVLPAATRGIFGAIILGLGRALGETMALAMLCGNANTVKLSLFAPANSLAALLANTFPEAGKAEVPVLMYAALILLGITLLVNVAGTVILERATGVTRKD